MLLVPNLLLIFGYSTLAFLLSMAVMPGFIAFLTKNKLGKQIREETVDGHQ